MLILAWSRPPRNDSTSLPASGNVRGLKHSLYVRLSSDSLFLTLLFSSKEKMVKANGRVGNFAPVDDNPRENLTLARLGSGDESKWRHTFSLVAGNESDSNFIHGYGR